jgi:putative lipoprotein
VRDERRRELCFEFHRWFDLRRYGMDEMKHLWYDNSGNPVEYKLEKNDSGFTLLIPQEAFNLNHSLVQNEKRGK